MCKEEGFGVTFLGTLTLVQALASLRDISLRVQL